MRLTTQAHAGALPSLNRALEVLEQWRLLELATSPQAEDGPCQGAIGVYSIYDGMLMPWGLTIAADGTIEGGHDSHSRSLGRALFGLTSPAYPFFIAPSLALIFLTGV